MSSHYAQDAVDHSPRSNIRLFQGPFYFLRHGQTQTNVHDLIAGWGDSELTDLGRRQAQAAAELLANHPITAIYSSALKRARDTAQFVADRLQLPITIIAELAERNWGVLEGQPRNVRVPGMTPEGGESDREFTDRVFAGLARIDSGLPLIVSHSGVHRVLLRSFGLPEAADSVHNAVPVKFVPSTDGWSSIPC
jgi:probable phosphoglycerate mutase